MMNDFRAGHDRSSDQSPNVVGYQPQIQDLQELDVSKFKEELGEFERVVQYKSPVSQVNIIVAIHNSVLGPPSGGFRVINYSSHDEALYDACRLASGMTEKAALADTGTGGGKMVAFAPEGFETWRKDDPRRVEYMREVGRAIELVNRTQSPTSKSDKKESRYFTAEDMGIKEYDIEEIATQTNFCIGRPEISGNPSPYTALGLKAALIGLIKSHPILAAKCPEIASANLRSIDIENVKLNGILVNVQGALGAVASPYVSWLARCGANIILSDKDDHREALDAMVQRELVEKYPDQSFRTTSSDISHAEECHVFSPCARGAGINATTVNQLKCLAILGCANNQILGGKEIGERLKELDIWYAPDFLVNAGGIINAAAEINRENHKVDPSAYKVDHVLKRVIGIMHKVHRLFERAKEAPDSITLKISPEILAKQMAKEIIVEEGQRQKTEGANPLDTSGPGAQ